MKYVTKNEPSSTSSNHRLPTIYRILQKPRIFLIIRILQKPRIFLIIRILQKPRTFIITSVTILKTGWQNTIAAKKARQNKQLNILAHKAGPTSSLPRTNGFLFMSTIAKSNMDNMMLHLKVFYYRRLSEIIIYIMNCNIHFLSYQYIIISI